MITEFTRSQPKAYLTIMYVVQWFRRFTNSTTQSSKVFRK